MRPGFAYHGEMSSSPAPSPASGATATQGTARGAAQGASQVGGAPLPSASVAPRGSARPEVSTRRLALVLLLAGFASFAELYAVQGLLPSLSADYGISAADSAWVVSAGTIGVAIGVFPWAWAAGRIGRLKALRLATIVGVLLMLVATLAPTLEVMLIGRLLAGVFLGGVPVLAVPYVYDLLSGRRAAVALATYISGTTIGGAGGRLLAGPLGEWLGWESALMVISGLSLLCAILFALLAPVPAAGSALVPAARPSAASSSARTSSPAARASQWSRIRAALAQPHLRRLNLQGLLITGVMVSFYSLIGFRLAAEPFHLSPTWTAFVFLAYFAGTVSSRLAGTWLPRFGFVRTDLVALALTALGLALTLVPHLAAVVAGVVIFTAGFFMAHSAAVTTVGATSSPQARSQASALYTLFFYLGSGVVGGLVAIAYDLSGWAVLIGVMLLIILLAGISALTTKVPRPEFLRAEMEGVRADGDQGALALAASAQTASAHAASAQAGHTPQNHSAERQPVSS